MRASHRIAIATYVVLGVGVAIFAERVASHFGTTRVELSRVKLSRVAPETAERLRALEEDVLATYYVSPRSEMPSELRRLEADVTDLLEALKRASGGTFDYQILDPHEADGEPDDGQAVADGEATYAARQGIAPFRVRSVTRDSWSERTIWSSLTIAYGAYPPAILNGLTREQLPRLSATILAHLEQMDRPRRPRIALAAPEGFAELERELAKTAEVERFELAPGAAIPPDSDLLFWMRPGPVDGSVLAEVDRYLARGRSVVVAGNLSGVRSGESEPGQPFRPERYEVLPRESGLPVLYAHLGLAAVPGLVCDERSFQYRTVVDGREVVTPLPFLVRCIAPNQRFGLVLAGQPNGTLLFEAPTPIRLLPEELLDRGWTPDVLAHTSDATWIVTPPEGPADARELVPAAGAEVSRQTLAAILRPRDPWQGSVVALASASPLRDDLLRAEGYAHRRLVEVLVQNLASDTRLVRNATEVVLPEPLPELAGTERTLWRAAAILGIPALLLAVALVRGAFRTEPRRRSLGGPRLRAVGLAALGVVLVAGATRLVSVAALRFDATEDGLNRVADVTARLAREVSERAPLSAELFLSDRDRLPPRMRRTAARVRELFDELERRGAGVELTVTDPERLSEAERAALRERGVVPVRATSREEGTTTVRIVDATLRLGADGPGERLVVLSDPSALEELEFRVALALFALERGAAPRVAFASDAPRLSPAEAHMDYQLKGLFAPAGDDPYSVARERLAGVGYEVEHLNPRAPEFPDELDALVWLQPRRDATLMIDAVARYLHGGGRAFVAAQHFVVQARQYRGTNFETVYWPQPQSPDLDRYWLPELSIDLVREVLLDELQVRAELETQVNRDADTRDYEDQASAQPFSIRAVASNFADDPVTRGVSDLAYRFGNRITWDDAVLSRFGLSANPLIVASDRAWAYGWTGGYLPEEVLAGRPPAGTEKVEHVPRAVLMARVRGTFPLPSRPILETETAALPVPTGDSEAGELLLLGCSELFKNEHLAGPEFRGDRLLLGAVADLALPPELAELSGRRRVARGFDYLSGEAKARWRWFVLAAGPVLLLVLGLVRGLVRAARPALPRGKREGSA